MDRQDSRNWLARTARVAAVAGALAAASVTVAQSAEDVAAFYQQNGFKIVVGSGAGGGYDTYARVLARTMKKHLPGNPTIVVQNMPGASGMTAQNWAYVRAPRDGSTILATYSALIEANLLGNKKAQFDVRKFNWVGSVASSPNGCMTWHTSPYKDIRQLVGKEVTASATGSTGKSATMPMLINELLGTKIKVITGYRTTETVLALERGEVDIICGLGYYTLAASNPDMITNKKIQYVVQTGLHSLEELKGTPNLLDLTTGKDRQLLEYIAILEELGRPYLAPPEVPAERLAAIRTAFAAAINDPELRTEFKKMNLNVTPIAGTEMEKMIAKLYSFPADVIERQARINGQRK